MDEYIWVGYYPSEVSCCCDVSASITKHQFVVERGGKPSDAEFIEYVHRKLKEMPDNSSAKAIMFDPQWAYQLAEKHSRDRDFLVPSPAPEILTWLNDKSLTRRWLAGSVKSPGLSIIDKSDARWDALSKMFPGYDSFVVQISPSIGGKGTYVLTKENESAVRADLPSYTPLLAAPYFESAISLNISAVVFTDGVIRYPTSVQFINLHENRLRYAGSDFLAARLIGAESTMQCERAAQAILDKMRKLGYRGCCGVDLILFNDEVYISEINPRFQGSSILINRALARADLPSLCHQHEHALLGDSLDRKTVRDIEGLKVHESMYRYKDMGDKSRPDCIVETTEESVILSCPIVDIDIEDSSRPYYDHFAELYHLMLPDWNSLVDKQGVVLPALLRKLKPGVESVLDCMCGIGTQVIGLAKAGFDVCGMDLSSRQIAWASAELDRLGLSAELKTGDCRQAKKVFDRTFDAVIAMDSAMVHLLTPEDMVSALDSAYECLDCGGVYLASFRDYDRLKRERPTSPYYPRVRYEDGARYTVVRTWDWGERLLTSHQYVIKENEVLRELFYDSYRQWPITKSEITELAQATQFKTVKWLSESDTGFYQPILCLVK